MLLDHHETLVVQLQLHHLEPELCEMKWYLQIHQFWWTNVGRSLPVWNTTNIHSARLQSHAGLWKLWDHALAWVSVQVCALPSYCMQLCALLQKQRMTPLGKPESALHMLFSDQKVDNKQTAQFSQTQETLTHKPLIRLSSGEPW